MCDSCFSEEIMGFNSQEEFERFDLELSRKFRPLTNSGLKHLDSKEYDFEKSYDRYLCRDCNTEWWLLEPSNYQNGFFVKKETGKLLISELRPKARIKPILTILVLIIIIAWIYFAS
jgi:hypothetical protein